jgi:hypothetical protein
MKEELRKKVETFREKSKTMEECELFLYVDGLGHCFSREQHGVSRGYIPEEVLDENKDYYCEMQEIALNAIINRFRVRPRPSEVYVQLSLLPDIPPKISEWNYRKWCRFWDGWISYFSDTEWSILSHRIAEKKDISEYLPLVEWDEVEKFSSDCMRSVMEWEY